MRRWLFLTALLIPVLLAGDPAADADPDDREKVYRERRREAFLRRAKQRVRPGDVSFGDIDKRVQTLADKQKAWQSIDEDRYARAVALIGIGKKDGLIREGALYYRWLLAPLEDGMRFFVRPHDRVPDDRDSDDRDPFVQAPIKESRVAQTLGGELDLRRRKDQTVDVEDLEVLRAAENSRVVVSLTSLQQVDELARPLVVDDEFTSELSERWLAVRRAQSAERLRAWPLEEASGLEDEAHIREKEDRLGRLRKRQERWGTRRDAITAALDDMARMELALTREAGRRTVQIEKEANGGDAAELERLQFLQWVERQELRLLYITGRRAVERLRLLDAVLEMLGIEIDTASGLLRAFEGERIRILREEQIERAASDGYEMQLELTEAEAALSRVAAEARPIWEAKAAALRKGLVLNEVVRRAVSLRRDVDTRLHSVAAPKDVDAKASELERLAAITADTIEDDITRVRANMAAMPASLVAKLHQVSDERVVALEEVQQQILSMRSLTPAYDQALADAKRTLAAYAELAETPALYWSGHGTAAERWRVSMEADKDAFTSTATALETAERTARAHVRALRALRRDLTGLGPRSFGCRVNRDLRLADLGYAWDDVKGVAGQSERWLTMRDDAHVGTFLQTDWWRVLAVLAILVGGLWSGRRIRGALGRWLDAQAQKVAVLRNGLSLEAEDAVERAHEEKAAAEVKALEETALNEAAGKESDPGTRATEGDEAPEMEARP